MRAALGSPATPTAPASTTAVRHRLRPFPAVAALGLGLLVLLAACTDDGEPPAAVGTLERDRLELKAETDDPIVEIAAREGDDLAAGDLILRLDTARAQAQLETRAALRDQARARLAELTRGPRQELIDQARARLDGDQKLLEIAELELERQRALAKDGIVPPSRVDDQRRVRDAARAQHDQDHAALAALLDGTTIEEVDQARAALAATEAGLSDQEIHLGRLEVRAPVAGRLDALPYELGERPGTGTVVAVLLAAGAPYARVYVPEPLLVAARRAGRAEVHVDGDPHLYRGRLRRLASEAAFTPHFALTERDRGRLAYLAEIDLDEAAARQLPTGVAVEARFPEGDPEARNPSAGASPVDDVPARASTTAPSVDGGDRHVP